MLCASVPVDQFNEALGLCEAKALKYKH